MKNQSKKLKRPCCIEGEIYNLVCDVAGYPDGVYKTTSFGFSEYWFKLPLKRSILLAIEVANTGKNPLLLKWEAPSKHYYYFVFPGMTATEVKKTRQIFPKDTAELQRLVQAMRCLTG
jgi:hypothetical protein